MDYDYNRLLQYASGRCEASAGAHSGTPNRRKIGLDRQRQVRDGDIRVPAPPDQPLRRD